MTIVDIIQPEQFKIYRSNTQETSQLTIKVYLMWLSDINYYYSSTHGLSQIAHTDWLLDHGLLICDRLWQINSAGFDKLLKLQEQFPFS